jgi:hypothetical protein
MKSGDPAETLSPLAHSSADGDRIQLFRVCG